MSFFPGWTDTAAIALAVAAPGQGMVVDNFAGGGGATTGIEQALGRSVDLAINHDEAAIAMHEVNHPGTRHIRNNIWQIDPLEVTAGRHVQLAWFSPDCTHHSKARGGKPRQKSIRDLSWVVILWAQKVKPDAIFMENVEEIRSWGPLDDDGLPIKERQGEEWQKWLKELRRAGYRVEFKELRACDYGAPTIRKRLFLVARSDGQRIRWPKPTHGKPGSKLVLSGRLLPYRTAADSVIDFSIKCPSIFTRQKPLVDNTLRRIAHGIMKFVVNADDPFIIDGNAPHITKFRTGAIGHSLKEPLCTVTANGWEKRPGGAPPIGLVGATLVGVGGPTYAGKPRPVDQPLNVVATDNHKALAGATLVQTGYGERPGQAPRSLDPRKPLGTAVGDNKFNVAEATLERLAYHMEQANGGPNNDHLAGRKADDPLSTIQTKGANQRVVASNIVKLKGTCRHGQPSTEPLATVNAQGTHHAEVETELERLPLSEEHLHGANRVYAFLLKYYGTAIGSALSEPLHVVTALARFALVTVTINGEQYAIVDIGMRMLTPRELFNAQGFPADYIIDFEYNGKPLTKSEQIEKCGNSVCPPMSRALVSANFPRIADNEQTEERIAA